MGEVFIFILQYLDLDFNVCTNYYVYYDIIYVWKENEIDKVEFYRR